jgi:hypothetical protein
MAGRSQMSCCLLPMTRVIFFKKAFSRLWGTCPATRALPLVGWTRPVSIFRVVVLPAPLGPKNPTTSPGSIRKETPSTALTVW